MSDSLETSIEVFGDAIERLGRLGSNAILRLHAPRPRPLQVRQVWAFRVDGSVERVAEIAKWVLENTGGSMSTSRVMIDQASGTAIFVSQEDAAKFKLFWFDD